MSDATTTSDKTDEAKAQPGYTHQKQIKLPSAVLSLDASPSGDTLWAACVDGGVYQVDPATQEHSLLYRHERYASGVVVCVDKELVVSGGYDGMLHWYGLHDEQPPRRVKAHDFWSWQLALAPAGDLVASVTGQYRCGGYKYEPAPETEPSVKVFDVDTGRLVRTFSHVPPVESVAFSQDGKHLAAGNLMGQVRVWNIESGQKIAEWTTDSFTGWGIIKGHYYTGGIFALHFTPQGEHVLAAGMGSTRDPAAGNGRQLWQRFAWQDSPPTKVDETHEGESGAGLMETLAFHPKAEQFVMAGRLFKGEWNMAVFDSQTGALQHSFKTGTRVTKARFNAAGDRLFLPGAVGQKVKKGEPSRPFGRIDIYEVG